MNQAVYVRSKVIKGFGRGSKQLGCPTANLDNISHITLPTGIYCGLAQLNISQTDQVQEEPDMREAFDEIVKNLPFVSSVKPMVCSFGYNPHFANKERSLEVHILDNFEFNFYGAEIRVLICKKMRDEEKYSSLEELKDAIANDIRNAKEQVSSFMHHTSNAEYFLVN